MQCAAGPCDHRAQTAAGSTVSGAGAPMPPSTQGAVDAPFRGVQASAENAGGVASATRRPRVFLLNGVGASPSSLVKPIDRRGRAIATIGTSSPCRGRLAALAHPGIETSRWCRATRRGSSQAQQDCAVPPCCAGEQRCWTPRQGRNRDPVRHRIPCIQAQMHAHSKEQEGYPDAANFR